MVYPEARIKELLHLLVPRHSDISSEEWEPGIFGTREFLDIPFFCRCFFQSKRSFDGFFSSVDEYHDLVAVGNQLQNALISYAVEIPSRG